MPQYKNPTSSRSPHKVLHVRTHNSIQVHGFILHPLLLHETFDVQTPTSKSLWYGSIYFFKLCQLRSLTLNKLCDQLLF